MFRFKKIPIIFICILLTCFYQIQPVHKRTIKDENKFILITVLYNERKSWRVFEYKKCIEKNLQNKMIKKIHVLYDVTNDDEKNEILDYLKVHKVTITPIRNRPSFSAIFNLANRLYPNSKIIISNADIYFNQTLFLLENYDLTGKFLTITRYEDRLTGILKLRDDGKRRGYSQDTWITKTPIPRINAKWIQIGTVGCEQLINYQAYMAGLKIMNPCLSIQCCHLHNSHVRNYQPGACPRYKREIDRNRCMGIPWQTLY